MLKKIVIALAAIVAIFVIAVALQPADFRVERIYEGSDEMQLMTIARGLLHGEPVAGPE